MKPRGPHAIIWSVAVGVAVTLGAYDARAQVIVVGPTTVHNFTSHIKGAAQDENKSGDDKIGRASLNQKDLAESCLDRSLSKTEKIVLVTDCGEPNSPAWILVVDTADEPATIVAEVIELELDLVARTEDKDGDTKQAEYAIRYAGPCFMMAANGFAKVSFKPLDPKVSDSPICAQNANGKMLGYGFFDPEIGEAVIESMSVNAGARSKKIEVDPDDLEAFLNQ